MDASDCTIDILYVEDDKVDIENVKRNFKKVNDRLTIAVAYNGIEALNMLCGLGGQKKLDPTPKIILLDINLPKMDGIELLKKLRADPSFDLVRVYVLTAAYDTKRKIAMKNLNVSGWFVKPLEYQDALNIMWALLHAD